MDSFPTVSVVIVNLNGIEHLKGCLKSLSRLDYPKDKLEIIVVDNGSTDESVDYLAKKHSKVKVLQNSRNEGFAQPSNDGAKAANGEYVAFLNNDMRVERSWLKQLLDTVNRTGAECVGSTILNWDGDKIDFVGGGITFYGKGHQYHYNEPASKIQELAGGDPEIMFACGGAMIIKRDVFEEVGEFDGDYFAYFEDVDLGWRLWLEGYKVRLSTNSLVYHKHNSTSKTFNSDKLDVLYERNKLYTQYKNYSDEMLNKLFWPSILVENRSIFLSSGIDGYSFSLENPDEINDKKISVSTKCAAKMASLNDFLLNINKMAGKRHKIQAKRKMPDETIKKFFDEPYAVFPDDKAELVNTEYDIVKNFGVEKTIGKELKLRILLISNDNVGVKMAGPGIRYWEMAKSLSNTGRFDVYLACPNKCDISYKGITTISYTISEFSGLADIIRKINIVVVQGFVLDTMRALRPLIETKYIIVDIYDPFMIENIEVFKEKARGFRNARHNEAWTALNYQLKLGDFFICANEKQKDYWIGMLSAFNRVTPKLYDVDKSGDKLVSIVPFGVADKEPVHSKNVLKGVWPGIEPNDKVIIWGGGVWNWFDPLTLIKAIKKISEQRSDIKLFFMGVKHPNPSVPQMKMLTNAVELAKQLDVYDKYVFFNFGWVDYGDRQNYLMEADIGVSCHFKTMETRFSFRTRILDYLWVGLPIVCTEGDYFSELVEHRHLGKTVPYQDVDALADALLNVLDDKENYALCKKNVRTVAESYKWSKIMQPIIDYCDNPIRLGERNIDDSIITASVENKTAQMRKSGGTGRHVAGSVQGKLDDLESRQYDLENSVKKIRIASEKTYDIALELQVWSYMMNERYNKIKHAFNPARMFRKIFKRNKS